LNKLLEKVKEEVIKALTPIATALGTTIGAMIGSGIPILGTAIGAAIGAIVGWVVGKVFEWFKSWWDDEIFAPFTVSANIPSLDARWNGNPESPQGEVSWNGYGGEYRLYYDWSITVPSTGSLSGIFQIQSKYSGKCLDLSLADGSNTVNGTNVHQWDCHGGNKQRWIFTRL
jgi:hypothetical protein